MDGRGRWVFFSHVMAVRPICERSVFIGTIIGSSKRALLNLYSPFNWKPSPCSIVVGRQDNGEGIDEMRGNGASHRDLRVWRRLSLMFLEVSNHAPFSPAGPPFVCPSIHRTKRSRTSFPVQVRFPPRASHRTHVLGPWQLPLAFPSLSGFNGVLRSFRVWNSPPPSRMQFRALLSPRSLPPPSLPGGPRAPCAV